MRCISLYCLAFARPTTHNSQRSGLDRRPLLNMAARPSSIANETIILKSQCHCRRVILDITLPKDPIIDVDERMKNTRVFNCHCAACRKYHTAAYVSYLEVPKRQISILRGGDEIRKYNISSCQSPGGDVVERWYCKNCSSKLLSAAKNGDGDSSKDGGNYRVNLGPIDDDTIPPSYSNLWKKQLKLEENNLHSDNAACSWKDALPNYTPQPTTTWNGGCACGACRYEIAITRPAQLQHCYCHMCREMSGGPYMTWIPVYKRDFTWKKPQSDNDAVELIRTTKFGSRHICSQCRGVLTIVYDSQPDIIWPCAGGLDDMSLPMSSEEMGAYLKRVCHICCRHLPPWLELPEDGMERIANAC